VLPTSTPAPIRTAALFAAGLVLLTACGGGSTTSSADGGDKADGFPLASVIALHDLNLAAMFCDRITVMKAGRVIAGGTPAEVITEELIEDVYGVRAVVTPDGPDGRPSVRFLPRR